ncbi:MAG: NYN domain-containing protein [Paracoccus sp. (in: a-proteobacteria)]|uniref:NYN domain-containing protein n=1 Tax=Paracoccus sp. TaxID=267 RepID=UPI0039195C3C
MNQDTPALARTTLLIDGSHVDRLKTKLGRVIDFQGLIAHFSEGGNAVSAHYYRDSRDSAEQERMARFFDWLARHDIERHGVDDFKNHGMSGNAAARTSWRWPLMPWRRPKKGTAWFCWLEMQSWCRFWSGWRT